MGRRPGVYGREKDYSNKVEQLTDAFVAILAGGHSLYEIDTSIRSDESL